MNLSGHAVKEAADMYKVSLQDIMVICDDLDLPLGKLRVRRSGGSGGHRGIESLIASLGSRDFSACAWALDVLLWETPPITFYPGFQRKNIR